MGGEDTDVGETGLSDGLPLAGDDTSILRSSLNNLNGYRLPCQLLKDRVAFVPFTMPAIGIDVAGLSHIDEAAAPGVCAVLRKRR